MIIKDLGPTHYEEIYRAMQDFTEQRTQNTADELWITEHYPVYTQGLAGKQEHILHTTHIPIVHTDRGGQVTYHGPEQLIFYPLLNLKRHRISPRPLVTLLEKSVIYSISLCGIEGYAKMDAPGIYVIHDNLEKKIASLGLRVRKGCCYHGIALNINMDLTPFSYINPCGYQGLHMVNVSDLTKKFNNDMLKSTFTEYFIENFKQLTKESSWRRDDYEPESHSR